MGDWLQAIVFQVEEPEHAARVLRKHLRVYRVVDAAADENGPFPAGARRESVVEALAPDVIALWDEVSVETGRGVTASRDDCTWACNVCQRRTGLGASFMEAVQQWFDGDEQARVECECGASTSLVASEVEPPWGFGNLSVTFRNWPPLQASYVEYLAQLMQVPATLVGVDV